MPTLTLRQGLNGYTGVHDTQIQQAKPTGTFATNNRLMADLSTGTAKQSLLTFTDLFGSGINQVPTGATITNATLTLQTSNASAQGGALHRMLIPWADTKASWKSLGSGIQFDGREAVTAADVVTGLAALSAVTLDVTSSLKAWQGGTTNYGWALNPSGTDNWEVYSSEGTTSLRPTLTVEYTLGAPANGLPDAVNDSASTNQGQAVAIAVLANDRDPDQDPLTVSNVTAPAHGTAVLGQNGTVTYTPAADYLGDDTFTYTISDGRGATDTATVSATVGASLPVITIQDGTPSPQIEGAGRQITFTLALDKTAAQDVTVHYTTSNGTAIVGSDYVAKGGDITFAAGQTTATVTVDLIDDTTAESTESFSLNLSSAANATLNRATATGTISDNDSSATPSEDTFFGTAAKDTFVIPKDSGRDWIYNFSDVGALTDDVLDLRAYRFGSLKEIGLKASGDDLMLDFSNSWTPINDRAQLAAGGFPDGPAASPVTPSSSFSDESIQKSPNGTVHRFGSRYGERRANDPETADRAELKHQTKYAAGIEIWISYNLMVEKQKPGEPNYTYQGVYDKGTNLGQFHGGVGSPIISWQLVDNNTLELWTRPQQLNTSSLDAGKTVRFQKNDFERGKEYDVVMHIKTAPDAKGSILQAWIEGDKVIDLGDIPLGYTDSVENNWLWGVYRRTNEISLDVQFANMEVGTTNLSHRIANPLPLDFGTPDFDGINTLMLKGYLTTHSISQISDNILL